MSNYKKLALTLNLVVFIIIFLVHLYRILTGFVVQFGSWFVPIWLNVIFALMAIVLIYLNYKAFTE